jgi:hypothetical protein
MRYLVCRAAGGVVTFSSAAARLDNAFALRLYFARQRLLRFSDLARHLQSRDQFARGHIRGGERRKSFAPDRGVDHAKDKHQYRRHQIDRDRAGPVRYEIAGVTQHRLGGRQCLKPDRFDLRHCQDLVCGVRERRRNRAFHLADNRGLTVCQIGSAPPAEGAMKLDDSAATARLTAGATEVCCRLAITPISVSDSVANASLRAAIGPRSLINSRIFARLLLPCSYKAETRLTEA